MRRTKLLSVFLVLLVSLLLTQCTPAAPPAAPPTAPPADSTAAPAAAPTSAAAPPRDCCSFAEQPKQGGTLVTALSANPEHLNISISSSVAVALPSATVTEGLVRLNRQYQPQPALAESWELSQDGTTITFHLRSGVKWHDGKPFTAADVKYSYENLSPLHSRAAPVFKRVASIETPDELTVVIQLKEPFGPFVDFLTSENAGISPKHVYEGTDPVTNPANQHPIGTGPFMFESWRPSESITFVRNPNYWDTGKPYLDKVVFRVLPDGNSRMLALESGDVDFVSNYDISFTDVARLQKTEGLVVTLGRGHPRVLLLFFNIEKAPMDNVLVRQALFRALDRELMFSSGYAGIGGVGTSSIPAGMAWANNPDVNYMDMYAFDVEQANKDLDAAGFPKRSDGTRFELRFLYDPAQPGYKEVADIVRANWETVGVKVTVEPRERSVWLDQVYMKKDFDTTMAWYTSSGDPVFGIQRAYTCADVRPASFTNASQYCNPDLDKLFEQGAVATTKEERAKFYREAQTIIARDVPAIVLLDSGFADAIRDSFGNVEVFLDSPETTSIRYSELYLK